MSKELANSGECFVANRSLGNSNTYCRWVLHTCWACEKMLYSTPTHSFLIFFIFINLFFHRALVSERLCHLVGGMQRWLGLYHSMGHGGLYQTVKAVQKYTIQNVRQNQGRAQNNWWKDHVLMGFLYINLVYFKKDFQLNFILCFLCLYVAEQYERDL